MNFNTSQIERIKSPAELIEEFCSRRRKWSFSALSQILFSPRLFLKERILKEVEKDDAAHFNEGTLTHCMILESSSLAERYIVQSGKVPEDKQAKIMDKIYQTWVAEKEGLGKAGADYNHVELADYSALIVEEMVNLNYYQNLKTDEQRVAKFVIPDNIEYFSFLKTCSGKTIVSQDTWDYCSKAAEYIKSHPKCAHLLGLYPEFLENSEIINEQLIEIEPTEEEDGWRGFLDSVHLDHANKIIYLNDLKTSGKPLSEFQRSVFKYQYHLQISLYYKLVCHKYGELIDAGYQVVVHLIVVDSGLCVYPFPVREESIFQWTEELKQAQKKAGWHIQNRSFSLPYAYELNLVEL